MSRPIVSRPTVGCHSSHQLLATKAVASSMSGSPTSQMIRSEQHLPNCQQRSSAGLLGALSLLVSILSSAASHHCTACWTVLQDQVLIRKSGQGKRVLLSLRDPVEPATLALLTLQVVLQHLIVSWHAGHGRGDDQCCEDQCWQREVGYSWQPPHQNMRSRAAAHRC